MNTPASDASPELARLDPGWRATSRAAVGRAAGVTSATVSSWITKGWLPTDGPWTAEQITAASARGQRGGRKATAPHGTLSRWRAGCLCEECRHAHNTDTTTRRAGPIIQAWAERGDQVIADVAAGHHISEVLTTHGFTANALIAQRHRDPDFAQRLDQALMDSRDPTLTHGTHAGWRARCRCPECRTHHNTHR